ncbi:zinc finger protein 501-like [Dunckerocampus dactyliophorus]|uniref:zinc finger protein 501-like n=1 Tax=Dunckerocampus dactyliophorus TaxID=161453 RepID=UPI0024052472|nr:zinc finger protein 501-like [Dunckerocampus dactyliophorus]XP_054654671.1 zinc finger protein 501-like [Dunckerocampus dactyliophorus]XP_054654672.1 zinc finger protein 501-like [Dunckerocampus dactyliophorus]
MAESETECDTPGLDTLGSECVIAHNHVDLYYGAETEIMTDEKHGLELQIHVDGIVETDHDYIKVEPDEIHCFARAEIKTSGEPFLLKTENEHVVKVESDHGGELTVESENGVIIHEAHGLQCNECGEIFGSIADLHQHFEIHKDLNPYICVHCGESFAVEASLKQHMKIHMKEKPYVPPGMEMMSKDIIDAFSLKSHQMIHLPDKPHRCSECGKSFAAAITLREHMKMHSEDKPYKCTQCRKSFVRRRHLKKHQEVHAREKPYTCGQCGKGFATTSNLKQHQKTHAVVVLAADKPHQCTQCGKCFAAATTLREHQKIHMGEKPYKCNMCRKSFARKRHLKKHQQVHAGGKPYTCRHCNKGFNHSSSLSRHHKTHKQGPVFSPPQPGKPMTFASPPKQRVHLQGEKPYMCHHCDKGFNHSSSLSRHQRVHSEGKGYNCGHCGKTFNRSSSLARHQRLHLENKQQLQQPQSPHPEVEQYSTMPTPKGFVQAVVSV